MTDNTADAVYAYIVAFSRTHLGNAPTYRQIARGVGIAHSVAYYHVAELIGDGLLCKRDGHVCVTGSVWTAMCSSGEVNR